MVPSSSTVCQLWVAHVLEVSDPGSGTYPGWKADTQLLDSISFFFFGELAYSCYLKTLWYFWFISSTWLALKSFRKPLVQFNLINNKKKQMGEKLNFQPYMSLFYSSGVQQDHSGEIEDDLSEALVMLSVDMSAWSSDRRCGPPNPTALNAQGGRPPSKQHCVLAQI